MYLVQSIENKLAPSKASSTKGSAIDSCCLVQNREDGSEVAPKQHSAVGAHLPSVEENVR
jgi:hypothetical protein